MTKKIRNLIIGGVVLLLIISVIVVLKLTENSENTSSESESFTLLETTLAEIQKVQVENEYGQYVIMRDGDDFVCEELKGVPIGEGGFSTVTQNAASIKAEKNIGNPSDLDNYGLKNAASTVEIKYGDNNSFTLLLGDLTPDQSSYYCKPANSDEVYIISLAKVSVFLQDKLEFVDTRILPVQTTSSSSSSSESETEEKIIESIQYSSKDLDYTMRAVRIEADEEADVDYKITAPVSANMSSSSVTTYISGVMGYAARKTVAVFPEPSDLEEYGLDDPSKTFEITIDGVYYKVLIGDVYQEQSESEKLVGDDGETLLQYYTMLEGRDVVYLTTASENPWIEAEAKDIIAVKQISPGINDVKEIIVKTSDQTYTMQLSLSDDELPKAENVTINGNDIDMSLFRSYFTLVTAAPAEDINFEKSDHSAEVEITFKYWDDSHEDILSLIPVTDRSYILSINGEQSFQSSYEYVKRLVEETTKIAQNEEVVTQW